MTTAQAVPKSWNALAHSSVSRSAESAQAYVPGRNSAKPLNRTGRLPKRSVRGPKTNCPTASAARKTASMIWTGLASTPNDRAIAGKDGVRRLRRTARSPPSSRGEHGGRFGLKRGACGTGTLSSPSRPSAATITGPSQVSPRRTFGLIRFFQQPPAERLDAASIDAEIVDADPRCRADMDQPFRSAKTALEVVRESEPCAAYRMDIAVCRSDEVGMRRLGQQVPQPAEGGRGIPRCGERLDTVEERRVASAADAGKPGRTRQESLNHRRMSEVPVG